MARLSTIANAIPRERVSDVRQRKAQAALTQAQARQETQNADYYDSVGGSAAKFAQDELNHRREQVRLQERRLLLQQAQDTVNQTVGQQIEYAHELASSGIPLSPEFIDQGRTAVREGAMPLANMLRQFIEEDLSTGATYSTFMAPAQMLDSYSNLYDMALSAGFADYAMDSANTPQNRREILDDAFSNEDRTRYQAAVQSMRAQSRAAGDMVRIIENLMLSGTSPTILLEPQGPALGLVQRGISAVEAFGNYFVNIFDEDNNLIMEGPPRDPEDLAHLSATDPTLGAAIRAIEIPEEIRLKGASSVAQYQSVVTRFAFMLARMEEPGNNRLSNQDFELQVRALGQNAGTIEGLLSTLISRMDESMAQSEDLIREAYARGTAPMFGLTKEEIDRGVLGIPDSSVEAMEIPYMSEDLEKVRTRIRNVLTEGDVPKPSLDFVNATPGFEDMSQEEWDTFWGMMSKEDQEMFRQ